MDGAAQEILDRVRRTETRVTKIGNHLGIDVGGGKPSWDDGQCRIVLPSPNCSIGEVVNAIPATRAGRPVDIYIGNEHFTTIIVNRP